MAVELSIADNIKMLPVGMHVGSVNTVLLIQSEGHIVNPLHGRNGMGIITVGDYTKGCKLRKFMEGFLNIFQILEVIQMIRFHIQYNSQGREEI